MVRGFSAGCFRGVTTLLFLLGFLVSLPFQAQVTPQEPDQKPRAKIGLVLEGGGALGLAHIGVLQWLYEHAAGLVAAARLPSTLKLLLWQGQRNWERSAA